MHPKKLKEASTHLFYEIDMLNISAIKTHNAIRKKMLAKDRGDKEKCLDAQIELNAYLDSFAIHARNLIDFFKGKIIKGKTYIRAEHYLDEQKIKEFRLLMRGKSDLVKYILDKANHQVAHLTFDRIEDKFKGSNKGWDLNKIEDFNEIIKQFLTLTIEEFLCDNLIKWKKMDYPFRYYIQRYIEK